MEAKSVWNIQWMEEILHQLMVYPLYIYTYIYIFVGFQQVSKIQSAGFLPSVGVRFAFWQPRNLASRPEIRHENLRCSVVHIRKTGGYQRQGSELSQVGDILRVRFLFSSILQPSDDSHLMSLLLLLCIHFFLVVPSRCYANEWPGVLWMQLVAPWRFSRGNSLTDDMTGPAGSYQRWCKNSRLLWDTGFLGLGLWLIMGSYDGHILIVCSWYPDVAAGDLHIGWSSPGIVSGLCGYESNLRNHKIVSFRLKTGIFFLPQRGGMFMSAPAPN